MSLKAFVAMGLVGSVVAVVSADPAVINVTGATLQSFVKSPASTHDFIDADPRDGVTLDLGLGIRRQHARIFRCRRAVRSSTKWLVHYRACGLGERAQGASARSHVLPRELD